MRNLNILSRFLKYYQKNGVGKTLKSIFAHSYRIIFKGQMLLFYADMDELHDSVLNMPGNITIECKSTYQEALRPDMQRIVNYWNEENSLDKTRERFEKGAIFWILKLNDVIAGFGWSIRGKMVAPYYLPLTPHDAVFFDYFFFEEFRGQGLYKLLIHYMFWQIKIQGVHRVFGHAFAWNTSSIHGLEKTYFRKFSEARKLHIFGRNLTIWS